MPRPRPEPGSAAEWLQFAQSDLALAKISLPDQVFYNALCFHAQQAAEKSIKALLVRFGIHPPKTHSIESLLAFLPKTLEIPPEVEWAAGLTDYAVTTRYPGDFEEVLESEWKDAVRMAEEVFIWAKRTIESQ
ncbi:MAG: HEPN domain-containing protein [Thermodesulfobacteriota bacterium]|nr:HEPN domain-containing protein [Thermodesulfobacteriota bacterium]